MPRHGSFGVVTLAVAFALALGAAPSWAQQTAAPDPQPSPTPQTRSGYEDIPQFGGPNSVAAQLKEDDEVKESLFRLAFFDDALQPWFDAKGRIKQKTGFSYGLTYNPLYQWASENPGEDEAGGGIFQVFGSWGLLGRGSDHPSTITFQVEQRHTLGTPVNPNALGPSAGSSTPTAFGFSSFGWGVTSLYWEQVFNQRRQVVQVGALNAIAYVDTWALANPLTGFLNQAFSYSPTIAIPGQGLGVVAGTRLGAHGYVTASLSDANGVATKAGFDSFFDTGEYFTHVEAGWFSSYDRRNLDNVHVTAWHADERQGAGKPESWGVAFSATRYVNDWIMPFLRGGYSHGGAARLEGLVAGGVGIRTKSHDVIGLGVAWARPSAPVTRDQYLAEVFWRLQLAQNLAFTPDFQLVFNPTNDPDKDVTAFFGVRLRLTL